jgi:hypothetical protein
VVLVHEQRAFARTAVAEEFNEFGADFGFGDKRDFGFFGIFVFAGFGRPEFHFAFDCAFTRAGKVDREAEVGGGGLRSRDQQQARGEKSKQGEAQPARRCSCAPSHAEHNPSLLQK